jgi:hypothetical protein
MAAKAASPPISRSDLSQCSSILVCPIARTATFLIILSGDILTDLAIICYQTKRSGDCRSSNCSIVDLGMIFILVFVLALVFIFAVAMVLLS